MRKGRQSRIQLDRDGGSLTYRPPRTAAPPLADPNAALRISRSGKILLERRDENRNDGEVDRVKESVGEPTSRRAKSEGAKMQLISNGDAVRIADSSESSDDNVPLTSLVRTETRSEESSSSPTVTPPTKLKRLWRRARRNSNSVIVLDSTNESPSNNSAHFNASQGVDDGEHDENAVPGADDAVRSARRSQMAELRERRLRAQRGERLSLDAAPVVKKTFNLTAVAATDDHGDAAATVPLSEDGDENDDDDDDDIVSFSPPEKRVKLHDDDDDNVDRKVYGSPNEPRGGSAARRHSLSRSPPRRALVDAATQRAQLLSATATSSSAPFSNKRRTMTASLPSMARSSSKASSRSGGRTLDSFVGSVAGQFGDTQSEVHQLVRSKRSRRAQQMSLDTLLPQHAEKDRRLRLAHRRLLCEAAAKRASRVSPAQRAMHEYFAFAENMPPAPFELTPPPSTREAAEAAAVNQLYMYAPDDDLDDFIVDDEIEEDVDNDGAKRDAVDAITIDDTDDEEGGDGGGGGGTSSSRRTSTSANVTMIKSSLSAVESSSAAKQRRAATQKMNVLLPRLFSLDEAFDVYIQFLVSAELDADFLSCYADDATSRRYFQSAIRHVQNAVLDRRDYTARARNWQPGFRNHLETLPVFKTYELGEMSTYPQCESCQRKTHASSTCIVLSGAAYDAQRLWSDTVLAPLSVSDKCTPPSTATTTGATPFSAPLVEATTDTDDIRYYVGSFCHLRTSVFHSLHHYKRHLICKVQSHVMNLREKLGANGDDAKILDKVMRDAWWRRSLRQEFDQILENADQLIKGR